MTLYFCIFLCRLQYLLLVIPVPDRCVSPTGAFVLFVGRPRSRREVSPRLAWRTNPCRTVCSAVQGKIGVCPPPLVARTSETIRGRAGGQQKKTCHFSLQQRVRVSVLSHPSTSSTPSLRDDASSWREISSFVVKSRYQSCSLYIAIQYCRTVRKGVWPCNAKRTEYADAN